VRAKGGDWFDLASTAMRRRPVSGGESGDCAPPVTIWLARRRHAASRFVVSLPFSTRQNLNDDAILIVRTLAKKRTWKSEHDMGDDVTVNETRLTSSASS
jgi:hypothetical protein